VDALGGEGALRVAYVVRSWPRLSQTFVLNEVLALERSGLELDVFAMVPAGEDLVQPGAATVAKPVRYLDAAARRPLVTRLAEHQGVLTSAPGAYLRTRLLATTRPDLADGYANATTRECFDAAVHLAAVFADEARQGRPVAHLHAHFAHDPALVAFLVHRLTGMPFSFTAHARDLYGVPPAALAERAVEAAAVVTCCSPNAAYLRGALPEALHERVHVIHHGVDVETFSPPADRPPTTVPRVVSVGRLVEKKGFADLLDACARVAGDGRAFTLDVYGEGPLLGVLEARRDELGLTERVTFAGARVQADLLAELGAADLFALTPFVTDDGDRDGVPNVLVEAMACGLPVVTTDAGGITDLVADGENGIVATPHDVENIASALARLVDSADERRRLGAAARQTVEDRFDLRGAAARLERLFAGAG